MPTLTGLDSLILSNFEPIRGKSIGLVCNQASVTKDYRHALDLVVPASQSGVFKLAAVFGPQHGLFGHTQDNMIEWEGAPDPRIGVPIHSLYGERREPSDSMLEGVEEMVIDIFDVGARYYTFIWTLALCIKACEARGIAVTVLDRPNPIGGSQLEGNVQQPGFESFVGLHPLLTRHGMTAGEIAGYLVEHFYPKAQVKVLQVQGWDRSKYLDETDAPWAMPSPNMPTVETAVVYPGGCFLEGTNISEGRGTTRPFETLGAAWLDGWKFADALNGLALPGVYFRPLQFQPTFHKFKGETCEGVFVHVTDRATFEPVLTYVAIMQEIRRQAGDKFTWNPPPYEYEHIKLPIDILAGNIWLREAIDGLSPLAAIRGRFQDDMSQFIKVRNSYLRY